jgi:DNA-binding IclR family transcriptional regulator
MAPPFFPKLVQRIREEFEDAPHLRMTVSEAARFWALDLATCERVLSELLQVGFIVRGPDQRYSCEACQV